MAVRKSNDNNLFYLVAKSQIKVLENETHVYSNHIDFVTSSKAGKSGLICTIFSKYEMSCDAI